MSDDERTPVRNPTTESTKAAITVIDHATEAARAAAPASPPRAGALIGSEAPAYLEDFLPRRGTLPARSWARSDAPELSLNGVWAFRFAAHAAAPLDLIDDEISDHDWARMPVPGHWQLNGFGAPAYTNRVYPFPVDPPRVPSENPTGDYRHTFDVPADWNVERVLLRFDGIDSVGRVWLNGVELGITSGSRLASEFDVTDHIRRGEPNLLAVRVHQWSSATYLEDQDMWWLSGIFRDVTLLGRPAAAIDDHWVHADFDAETGAGVLRVDATIAGAGADGATVEGADGAAGAGGSTARVLVPELGIDVAAGEEIVVPGVEAWSAEHPRLYDGVLASAGERIALRIGFRRVRIDGVSFEVNGTPILMRGVNRHDIDPDAGRVVSEERMRADILLMKQHNINAVRTSHYPPQARFLELCDELGLWVIDECDLETHGFYPVDWFHELQGNPAGDPRWEGALVDRMQRLVERDKNRPSVIMWSLGNECGRGENLGVMARWAHDRDPSRPLHYERDWSCEYVDVYSRMYTTQSDLELIGLGQEEPWPEPALDAARRGMPFILCEYAHSMGNGPGGLAEYQEVFEKHPRLAGGFVWELFDHTLRTRTADGVEYSGYGGDFGETLHDANFVADGLAFSDGTPGPGLLQLKAVYAPLRMTLDEASLTVESRFDHESTAALRFVERVELDGVELSTREVAVPVVAARSAVRVAVADAREALPAGAVVTVSAVLAADTSWAPAGHEVAWVQRVVERAAAHPAVGRAVERDGVGAGVGGGVGAGAGAVAGAGDAAAGGFMVGPARFDRSGTLVALGDIDVDAIGIDVWRAPIDNDRSFSWSPKEPVWRRIGLDRATFSVDSVSVESVSVESVSVESFSVGEAHDTPALVQRGRLGFAGSDLGFGITLTWTGSSDAVTLRVQGEPKGVWTTELPRFGIRLGLPAALQQVEWQGFGPGEAYSDSRSAVRLGRWASTVDEMQTPYPFPQENGNRIDTSWLRLSEAGSGAAIEVTAHPAVDFTVRPWTSEALAAAAHPFDLVADGRTWLNLDYAQNGLGSASCGPQALPAQRLLAAPFDYAVTLSPRSA